MYYNFFEELNNKKISGGRREKRSIFKLTIFKQTIFFVQVCFQFQVGKKKWYNQRYGGNMLFEVNHRDFFFASTPSNLLLHVHIFHFIRMNLVFLQIFTYLVLHQSLVFRDSQRIMASQTKKYDSPISFIGLRLNKEE